MKDLISFSFADFFQYVALYARRCMRSASHIFRIIDKRSYALLPREKSCDDCAEERTREDSKHSAGSFTGGLEEAPEPTSVSLRQARLG